MLKECVRSAIITRGRGVSMQLRAAILQNSITPKDSAKGATSPSTTRIERTSNPSKLKNFNADNRQKTSKSISSSMNPKPISSCHLAEMT